MKLNKIHNKINKGLIAKSVIAIFLIGFLGFSAVKRLEGSIQNVDIEIVTRNDNKQLINADQVRNQIKDHIGYDLMISSIAQLDLIGLERFLSEDDRIESVEVYLDKRSNIKIRITQKNPIVRIDVHNGVDYYLDYKGNKIPIVQGQIVRVPVVTGQVDAFDENFREDENNNLNDVLAMSQKCVDDEFLKALIEQIHIDKNDEIILVPKVGRSKILLGQIESLDEKIYKLKTYYKEGISKMGIDKFDELNMKYEGHIVGVNNT